MIEHSILKIESLTLGDKRCVKREKEGLNIEFENFLIYEEYARRIL